jgi:hypothetical protein
MQSKFPYILAVISGLALRFVPDIQPALLIPGLIYFFAGIVFGFLWPKESWRWGIWIVGPVIVLTSLSVLFAGQLEIFLKKDLPVILIALIAACLGSFISAWFKSSRTKKIEK